jgi:acyl carrier protein phosphodiesterase
MSAAQLLKSLIKGTDISEDAVLDKYLMSRGINPKFATKDQKVSHSKTGAFITWKNSRMIEDTLEERVDKKDSVILDIPLLIRIMELAREDIKTDMDLHRVVEKLINIRNKGMLTMKDYNYIAKIHEEVMSQVSQEVIDEVSLGDYKEKATQQVKELKPHTKGEYSGIAKRMLQRREKGLKMASTREEVELDEVSKSTLGKYVNKARSDRMDALHSSYRNADDNYEADEKDNKRVEKRDRGINLARAKINKFGKSGNTIAKVKATEEVELDEVSTDGYHKAAVKSRMDAAVKVMSSMGSDKQAVTKLNARNKGLNRLSDRTSAEMKKANSGPQKPREVKTPSDAEQRGYGQGRYMGDSVEHQDETMVEAQSAAVRWQKALEAAKKKREDEATRNAENAKRALTPVKEDKFQDSMAATQTVGMEVDNPSDADRKSQMSKSARIIKSIYKRKNMKEDLYDHEKDDKPAATYGKKPKMSVTKPTDNVGENKPDAAAILTGGKTLTGQTRDTIEIDPMMKKRPGSDPTGKNK